jgi:hypothetical protein
MSEFCLSSTRFTVFIPGPVTTGFLRFFAVPVRSSWILKLSGTGPVRGPSKKGTRTKTGPDFKALDVWPVKGATNSHRILEELCHVMFAPTKGGRENDSTAMFHKIDVVVRITQCRIP